MKEFLINRNMNYEMWLQVCAQQEREECIDVPRQKEKQVLITNFVNNGTYPPHPSQHQQLSSSTTLSALAI